MVVSDMRETCRRFRLIHLLGWQDLRARYKRSWIGPFWLTLSTGALIATISVVMASVSGIALADYVPFVTAGYIFWHFATSLLTEGCKMFISAESMIRQVPVPLFVYFLRVVWLNLLRLSHDIVLFPLALIIFQRPIGLSIIWILPGFLLLLVNVGWITLVLGVLSTRFRDVPMMVSSVLPVLFYFTPIIWKPSSVKGDLVAAVLQFNPFYHMLDLVRSPLLGHVPSAQTWIACIVVGVVGWTVALLMYARCRDRIVFWL